MLVDQFLHGYSNGHRLLAASRQPDDATASVLLAHSDAPALPKGRVIASLPLPKIRSWALTAVWAATDAPRPGSVWSHTLLLGEEALGELRGAGGLLSAFAIPNGPDDYARYSRPIDVPDRPAMAPGVDGDLVRAILLASYGWPERPTAVLTEDLDDAVVILLAVWQRQWPALRQSFSFRTRQRLSEEPRSGVEVARRPARREETERVEIKGDSSLPAADPAWIRVLASDIRRSQSSVQDFLWTFGPEAPRNRSDLPALTRIYADLLSPETSRKAIGDLIEVYPDPEQMSGLKLELLGSAGRLWDVGEKERIELSIAYASAVPWQDLELAPRTLQLARQGDLEAFVEILANATRDGDGLSPERQEIIDAVASGEGVRTVRTILASSPSAAAAVIASNPQLLERPALWKGRERDTAALIDELARIGLPLPTYPFIDVASPVLAAKVLAMGLIDRRVVAQSIASAGAQDAQLKEWMELLRASNASRSDLVEADDSWEQVALAVAAEPQPVKGLFRKRASELAEHLEDMGFAVRLRVAAAIFRAAGRGKIAREATARSFATLHRASSKKDARELLLELLPDLRVPQEDLRVALRGALVDIVKEEDWDAEDIAIALFNAGPGASKVRDLTPKKSELRKGFDTAAKMAKHAYRAVRGR